MVRFYLFCAVILFFFLADTVQVARAQTHFNSCVSGTANNATVIVPVSSSPTLGGTPIANGDEIAVLRPNGTCAGVAVWNGANIAIAVWGDDEITDGGFVAGEALRFALWDASANRRYSTVQATYSTSFRSDGLYATDAIFELSALVGIAPPGAPTPVAPGNGATDVTAAPTLAWQPVGGATRYELQVSTSSGFGSTVVNQTALTSTSHAVSGLNSGTTYYWRVRAANAAGAGDYSAVFTFKTASPVPPPGTPTLSSPGNGATGVSVSPTLSWQAVSGAASYHLQIATSSSFTSTVVNRTGITSTSTSVSGLANGTLYYWRVRAINASGASGYSSVRHFTTANGTLDAPILLSPSDGTSGLPTNPTLSWQTVVGATGYELQISAVSDFSALVVSQPDLTSTSYEVAGLAAGRTYYWRVRSVNAGGTSVFTSSRSFTTAASHNVALQRGWNIISSYVIPSAPDIESVFEQMGDRLLLAKDEDGKVYWPEFGINEIGDWNSTRGYSVYVESAGTVTFTGDVVAPEETPISLRKGWSTVGYLRSSDLPVEEALASIGERVVLAKDVAGNIYMPALEINQIGSLRPGAGYMVYTREAASLLYPANTTAASKTVAMVASSRNVRATQAAPFSAHIIASSGVLAEGDEISAWVGNRQVGTGTVEKGKAVVLVVGDDPFTSDSTEGARQGEHITLRVGSSHSAQPLQPTSVTDLLAEAPRVQLAYYDNAVWEVALNGSATPTEENGTRVLGLEQNYPNPFDSYTTIRYVLDRDTDVKVEVYNLLGQQVRLLVSETKRAGTYEVVFDAHDLPSGLYVCRLQAGDRTHIRRMQLVK